MKNLTSERLKKNTDKILALWEERVTHEVSASHHLQTLALRHSLAEYLQQLADALSLTIDRTKARQRWDRSESRRVGRGHGEQRATSRKYTIDQLIFEYHILRKVIFDVLDEEEILNPSEREVIVSSIEQAVNDAATEFSNTLRDIQEQLSHTLAHDLRTPITAAKTSAQMILRHPDDVDNCKSRAARIDENMDRIDSMIRDLLDASRIRAGEILVLEFRECDLNWIVEEVADEMNATYQDRIRVSSPGKCMGNWNENGLRRVVENLVSNAIKYGLPDGVVTVSLNRSDESVILKVHNEGRVIADEEKAILFQQFHRAKSDETKVGWGIGLTVVKGMVDAHQGRVEVESEQDKGTTFVVELPIG